MTIIQCPNCHSKFRFSHDGSVRKTFRMRCSLCHHIFEHTVEAEVSLDQEFDMLLSSKSIPVPKPEQEIPFGEASREIAETPVEEAPPEEAPVEEPVATETVIREIDSLLGAAPEEEPAFEETILEEPGERKSHLKVAVLVISLLVIAMASLWLFRDKILFFQDTEQHQAQAPVEKGPFFTIDEGTLSHEVLTHEQEGSVLVIKGTLRRITPKPVESVMVEARVYDREGTLIESRIAYAGIVPDISEFTRQPQRDIDALLTSDPASPGTVLPAADIPFAVAFYGKTASEGVSFKVEVKELHWR